MHAKPHRKHKRGRRLRLEPLEARQVLSANPVITEFMASNSTTILDGDGRSSDWVEVYNPTSGPIDLGGWTLTDNDGAPAKWAFPPTVLGPNEYLLVFASNHDTAGYIDPSGYRHTTFALSAGGEYLGLYNPAGEVVSEFAPEYPAQSADVSYGVDGGGGLVYFSNPTPGAENDLGSAGVSAVVINEIMHHPSSEAPADEFLELYNRGATTLDLGGWTLSDGVDFTFPAVSLAPGEYLAVAADTTAFAALYPGVTNVVGGWAGRLSNRGETVTLLDASGRLVDSVSYSDQGDWADRELGPLDYNHHGWVWSDAHDGEGASIELVSDALTNDSGQNWRASLNAGGTPGAANSTADADNDVAPLVLDVAHSPIIPSSTAPVTVTARLVDEAAAGVSGALFWRVDGAAAFQSVPMTDDGANADATAGDRVYTAQLPALADGTIVEFYVQSIDGLGQTRAYPSPTQPSGEQLTNLLYQVDDSFDPLNLPAEGERPEYRLIMTEAERAELAQIGSSSPDRYSHARMNGALVTVTPSGVESRYRVGIRNRGRGSSIRQPNSYHVDIPRDNTWRGLEAFNLNTQYTQAQLAGLRLFQAAGAVAEDSQAVHVRVNGADLSDPGSPSYGVYMQLEAADSVFAANHFPEDDGGNLYKGVRDSGQSARADFRDLGDDPADYATYYEKQTNASEADYSDVMELVRVFNDEPDETFLARLSQIVDVDQWLTYFAAVAILGSEETSLATGVGEDFLMYRGVDDPRFVLIPHDFDTILDQGDTNGSPTGSIYRAANLPAIARLLYHPEVLPAYHAELRRLLTTTFRQDSFNAILDEAVGGFAPASRVDEMRAFMDARRDYILGLVDGPLTAVAPLAQQGGFSRTVQDHVALNGAATLAATRSVTAGGLLADYDAPSGQWSLGEATGTVNSLLESGHSWTYLTPGQLPTTTPGADWRVDNLAWPDSGPSKLGYGDSQATTVPYIDTDPGQSGTQKNITTYFQTTFDATDAAAYTSLTMQLLRDDGAVVYLNGAEVVRSNLPSGEITPTTLASSTVSGGEEEQFFEYAIDPGRLVEGQNVIAVEIHQRVDDSSDIGFDLTLSGVQGEPGSTGGVPLAPGVNRIEVNAYDGPGGTGDLIASTWVDVWYDTGVSQAVSGAIVGDAHWTTAGGPYVVTSDLTVGAGATLTIDPGVTVFFDSGAGLTVRDGGRLVAEGLPDQRIRFANNPIAGGLSWDGFSFVNTDADNRLTYVDMQAGGDSGQALFVDNATLLVDHASWLDVDEQILDLEHPKLTVRNSDIPGIGGNETIHLFGLDQDEYLLIENNTVGFNTSGDDVVDLGHDTLTPGTIVFRGNTFLGGFDDGVDTDGFPVLLEDNVFHGFHLNTSRNTTSNAVSTGHVTVGGQTVSSDLTLRGNVFYDNDHHLLLKDLSYAVLENNTFYDASLSAIHLEEPGGSSVIGPGEGASISGSLFWNNPITIEGDTAAADLVINQSLVPAELTGFGSGNVVGDPLLADPVAHDFSLRRGSPALDAGPGGWDIGAVQSPDHPAADARNLRVTELHYEPLAGDKGAGEVGGASKSFEFIELMNVGPSTIDLTDVAFDDGVGFTFPWLASLAPGEVIVVANNADLFASRYGDGPPVVGEYTGSLSNGGERVRLRDASGGVIEEINYETASPWADTAGGRSLEIANLLGDPSAATTWRASAVVGGSPGVVAAPTVAGDYDADGDVDQADYQVWRSQYGATLLAGLGADGNQDGRVDAADYTVWRDGYETPAVAFATDSSPVEAADDRPSIPVSVQVAFGAAPTPQARFDRSAGLRRASSRPSLAEAARERAFEDLLTASAQAQLPEADISADDGHHPERERTSEVRETRKRVATPRSSVLRGWSAEPL